MELDREQRLEAVAVPLRELKDRRGARATCHWTAAYPQHWPAAWGAARRSPRSFGGIDGRRGEQEWRVDAPKIKAMESSLKRPGSVRSLLTRATADCRSKVGGCSTCLHTEDGPTEMHQCEGGGRGGGGGAEGAGEELQRRGTAGGDGVRVAGSGGEQKQAASLPRERHALRERSPQPTPTPAGVWPRDSSRRCSCSGPRPATAREPPRLPPGKRARARLQERLESLEVEAIRLRERVAFLEAEGASLRRMLLGAALALIVLSLALCYAWPRRW